MAVFVCTVVDQAYDKKSSEAAHIVRVLELIAVKLQSNQGTLSGVQNIVGVSAAGVPNTVMATFTHTPSGNNP
jgi:hypothetical protein